MLQQTRPQDTIEWTSPDQGTWTGIFKVPVFTQRGLTRSLLSKALALTLTEELPTTPPIWTRQTPCFTTLGVPLVDKHLAGLWDQVRAVAKNTKLALRFGTGESDFAFLCKKTSVGVCVHCRKGNQTQGFQVVLRPCGHELCRKCFERFIHHLGDRTLPDLDPPHCFGPPPKNVDISFKGILAPCPKCATGIDESFWGPDVEPPKGLVEELLNQFDVKE